MIDELVLYWLCNGDGIFNFIDVVIKSVFVIFGIVKIEFDCDIVEFKYIFKYCMYYFVVYGIVM